MRRFLIHMGAAVACAAVIGCGGGGGDVEGSLETDGESVTGSFATCAPVGEPIAIASTQTRLELTANTLSMSVRTHLGTRCAGPALVVINFPVIALSDDGTQTVTGPPSGPTSVTAVRVNFSRGAGQLSWQGDSRYVRVTNGELQVVEPSSGLVLYDERVDVPALNEKTLLALVGNRIYLGNTLYDPNGYPSGLDYTAGWERL